MLKLKQLYEEKGVTQKEVSETTGIRASTLSGLANNMRTSWDVEILGKLIKYFQLTDIRDLITYNTQEEIIQQINNHASRKEVYDICNVKDKRNTEDSIDIEE